MLVKQAIHQRLEGINITDLNKVHTYLKKGDRDFFEALYVHYFEKLCAYGLSFSSDKDLVRDVVQDTFMYIWSHRKTVSITSSVKSYLYRMVYNKLMDTYRKHSKKDAVLVAYYKTYVDEAVNTDEDYKETLLKKLDDCIKELPLRCKEVFYNKKLKGVKNKQIATNLNISIKTVEAHITRAYLYLKKCLNPDGVSF